MERRLLWQVQETQEGLLSKQDQLQEKTAAETKMVSGVKKEATLEKVGLSRNIYYG